MTAITASWFERLERFTPLRMQNSTVHGPRHGRDVARLGVRLIRSGVNADAVVVLAFGVLHDSQRQRDGRDPDHPRRAADLVQRLSRDSAWPLSSEQTHVLEFAIRAHHDESVSCDPTQSACWDGDRLALWRLGIAPNPALLSSRQARHLDPTSVTDVVNGPDQDWVGIAEGAA